MNIRLLTATALSLSMMAPAVFAQSFSFDGAEISYTHAGSDDGYTGRDLVLSGQVSFGRVGAQLDYNRFGYDGEFEYAGYTAHVFYDISDTLTAGIFYNAEDWSPVYGSQGIEAAASFGAISVEGAIGTYIHREGGSFQSNFVDIDASYDFGNNLSANLNYTNTRGSDDIVVLGVGARYNFSGAFAEVGVSQFSGDYDHRVVSVQVGYEFGGGTTFDDRGWFGLYGLY